MIACLVSILQVESFPLLNGVKGLGAMAVQATTFQLTILMDLLEYFLTQLGSNPHLPFRGFKFLMQPKISKHYIRNGGWEYAKKYGKNEAVQHN